MDEIFDMVLDYLTLRSRLASLTVDERGRLMELSQVIPGTGGAPEAVTDDDLTDGMPVQVTSPGGFEPARMLAISRDGIRLFVARRPFSIGGSTVVRVVVPKSGVEYTFPCRVAWTDTFRAGLTFDGVPVKGHVRRAPQVTWRRWLDLRVKWGR